MVKSANLEPSLTLIRLAIATNDVIANLTVHEGMQTEDMQFTNFQVVPSGGANPSLSIYYWNFIEEFWVVDTDFTTLTGAGANTPYAVSVETKGRLTLAVLTSISAGAVDVYASTFGFSNRI